MVVIYEYISITNQMLWRKTTSDNFEWSFSIYFIFVKDEMHVDFIHNQRNTKNCMADKGVLGTMYFSADKLCKWSLFKDLPF